MKKYIFLLLLAFVGVFTSCEKDGELLVMSSDVKSPEFLSVPSFILDINNSRDTLLFTATPVDPGFKASVNYTIEVCASGDNFENAYTIYSGTTIDTVKMTVSDLNQIMLKLVPEDTIIEVDIRIHAVLVVDAGTGAIGTGDSLFEYYSPIKTVNASIFVANLDIINSGLTQILVSPLGDGVYFNYVKLNPNNAFTLYDPVTGTTYGGSGGKLAVDGDGIISPDSGWYAVTVDVVNMTYNLDPYMIGLVGSATPNGWNTPDQKMDYDFASGTWYITIDLTADEIKFRKNDDWGWNLGGTPDDLYMDGPNIPIPAAGNYTITLTITSDEDITGTCTIVQN